MCAGDRESVNEQEQPDSGGRRARQVVALADLGLAFADVANRGKGRGDRDRDVDQQRPAPGGELREHSAEHEADRSATTGDCAVHAKRLGALARLGEGHGQQR